MLTLVPNALCTHSSFIGFLAAGLRGQWRSWWGWGHRLHPGPHRGNDQEQAGYQPRFQRARRGIEHHGILALDAGSAM